MIRRYGDKCYYCDNWAETVDHYVPSSRGGGNSMENLRPACLIDNNIKSDMLPHEWWAYLQTIEYIQRRAQLMVKFGNRRPSVRQTNTRRTGRSSKNKSGKNKGKKNRRERRYVPDTDLPKGYLDATIRQVRERDRRLRDRR